MMYVTVCGQLYIYMYCMIMDNFCIDCVDQLVIIWCGWNRTPYIMLFLYIRCTCVYGDNKQCVCVLVKCIWRQKDQIMWRRNIFHFIFPTKTGCIFRFNCKTRLQHLRHHYTKNICQQFWSREKVSKQSSLSMRTLIKKIWALSYHNIKKRNIIYYPTVSQCVQQHQCGKCP